MISSHKPIKSVQRVMAVIGGLALACCFSYSARSAVMITCGAIPCKVLPPSMQEGFVTINGVKQATSSIGGLRQSASASIVGNPMPSLTAEAFERWPDKD